jgi:type VI protein secretion system component VasK
VALDRKPSGRPKGQLAAQLVSTLGAVFLAVGLTSSVHHHWADRSETVLVVVGAVILLGALPVYSVMLWRARPGAGHQPPPR